MLSVDSISKSFGQVNVLDNVSLNVKKGEIVALLGPSGSGKSTLLRIIAGLETADQGIVSLDGQDLTNIPPESRGIGMVFQSLALFPHLDVAGNVRYGLNKGENLSLVDIMLETVGLSGFGGRRIDSLSGGEAQRVALARSLIAKPYLMLLDEPLSSLDSDLKNDLATAVRTILKSTKTPAIHVTHDVTIAEILADRVLKIAELSTGGGGN
jgi:ABC-type Fe3+/spermidine/putrescine transport system ATPase subunit